jgi:hypothetical protein
MTSKQLIQLLKERWKSCLAWLGVFALLLLAFVCLGYAPIYGNDRLMVSRVMIVAALVGAIVLLTTWRASRWKLQRALIEDYGERCCAPIPKESSEDSPSADETA